jgi:hypothetical protein
MIGAGPRFDTGTGPALCLRAALVSRDTLNLEIGVGGPHLRIRLLATESFEYTLVELFWRDAKTTGTLLVTTILFTVVFDGKWLCHVYSPCRLYRHLLYIIVKRKKVRKF